MGHEGLDWKGFHGLGNDFCGIKEGQEIGNSGEEYIERYHCDDEEYYRNTGQPVAEEIAGFCIWPRKVYVVNQAREDSCPCPYQTDETDDANWTTKFNNGLQILFDE